MPQAGPLVAEPHRQEKCRRVGCAVVIALGVAATAGEAATSKRELALEYYQQAVAKKSQIESLPEEQRDQAAYQKLVNAFRRVYRTSAHSSKADDSLLAEAELYALMGARFGAAPYREKAAETYRFLLREYPGSPLCEQARQALQALEAAPAPVTAAQDRAPAPPPADSLSSPSPETARAGELAKVTAVRHWTFPSFTRVIVDMEGEVTSKSTRLTDPDRIYFDLPDTKLSPALTSKQIPVGDARLKQIRLAQTQLTVTRVVLDLNSDVEHTLSTMTNPPRVVVELKQLGSSAKALPPVPAVKVEPAVPLAAPPRAAQPDSQGQRNLIRALGLKIARVVIDAGHGGHDTGTVGSSGLMEKDLTLDVAQRLGALVADRIGSQVIFTRTDDSFVGLEDRTALANEKQADLFISIHANSSGTRAVRGVETYYLNLTSDRDALEVAARENAASQKSIHELQDLVSKITLTDKIAESREFAAHVQRSLHSAVAKEAAVLRNRGVRKAPFLVLIGARMPSVLAEVSFLSNPRDERLLKTPSYRQKIAEALFQGLARYARTLSQVEVAAQADRPPPRTAP